MLFTDFSFMFVSVYIFIPFMILPIYNALEELDPALIDAARDLGASAWTTFRRVIFPLTLGRRESRLPGRVHPVVVAVHDHPAHRRQPGHYARHGDRAAFPRDAGLGNGRDDRRIPDLDHGRHHVRDRHRKSGVRSDGRK